MDLLDDAVPEIETTSDGMRLTFYSDHAYGEAAADYEEPLEEATEIVAASAPMEEPEFSEPVISDVADELEMAGVDLEPVMEEPAIEDAIVEESMVADDEIDVPVAEEPVYEADESPAAAPMYEAEAVEDVEPEMPEAQLPEAEPTAEEVPIPEDSICGWCRTTSARGLRSTVCKLPRFW